LGTLCWIGWHRQTLPTVFLSMKIRATEGVRAYPWIWTKYLWVCIYLSKCVCPFGGNYSKTIWREIFQKIFLREFLKKYFAGRFKHTFRKNNFKYTFGGTILAGTFWVEHFIFFPEAGWGGIFSGKVLNTHLAETISNTHLAGTFWREHEAGWGGIFSGKVLNTHLAETISNTHLAGTFWREHFQGNILFFKYERPNEWACK